MTYHQDWEELGRSIEELVDRAVNSQDYQKLNQTVRQTVERAVDLGSSVIRRTTSGSVVRPSQRPAPQPPRAALPVLYRKPGALSTKALLKTVGGGLLTAVSLPLFLFFSIATLVTTGVSAVPMFVTLAGLGGSTWLLGSGIFDLNRVKRYKAYLKTLGQKTHCTLEKLAGSVGKSVKFVRRELQKMIRRGFFLEGHLDKEEANLITSHETYRYFEQSRLQLEHRQRQAEEQAAAQKAAARQAAQDPRLQEVTNRGNAFIARIRACNDAIPGEEISSKIDRMELIVRRIFQRAQAHPEILPDLKKLMDYYLPMTVKLLDAYADMDAQAIQGQTILASKKEIEDTLDTLNLAYEKLLDDLFRETAMDVSSDISVLNTLLAQEGLTEDPLTKLKNGRGE